MFNSLFNCVFMTGYSIHAVLSLGVKFWLSPIHLHQGLVLFSPKACQDLMKNDFAPM